MQIWSTNSGWFQLFKYKNNQFINWTNNKVLDVSGGKDEEGSKVIVYGNHGKVNQRWNVVYLDQAEKVQAKGLSGEFGFHINRPFYIRSRLPMKRVAECHGANNVWLKRWRKNVTAQ
jgi:bacillopeptidase F (M6 metalloprotease family)